MRFFNTAGPVVAVDHYCIPPLDRVDTDEILMLIQQKKYLVLHAPRQTGKTSTLLAMADRLNSGGKFRCVYANFEAGQAARDDTGRAMRTLLGELGSRATEMLHDDFVARAKSELLEEFGPDGALNELLVRWSASNPMPLVVLIDEIDSLIGDTLISALRQLRSGYDRRPARFPQSVILCGVRDVRDYRIRSSSGEIVLGGSAFNIKAKSLRLGDFSEGEARSLLGQHARETGQAFSASALSEVWELTRGQPWLVNALAYEACFEDKAGRDRSRPITLEAIREARERLILRRDTHLDQLVYKLREPRVRRVIEPLLSGGPPDGISGKDISYVRDLGLVGPSDPLEIANPIYREVIPRELTSAAQSTVPNKPAWYVDADGRLLVRKLLAAFQEYFRENSEHWVERFGYKEAGPQLLLQAFLQRIVSSGGRIEREYGLGRMRTDLLLVWPVAGEGAGPQARQKVVIECKLLHGSLDTTLAKGLQQTRNYMERAGTDEGHLVIFDCTRGATWDERIYCREEQAGSQRITVWGM